VIRVDRTAYISEPVWARWSQEGLYLWGYVLMFVAGFAAVTGLDFPAREAGWFVMGGAVVSAAGVLTRFYHVEALGLYPIIFGLGVCVVWLVVPPQNAVLTGWLVAGSCCKRSRLGGRGVKGSGSVRKPRMSGWLFG
jgi:hypothetical protein